MPDRYLLPLQEKWGPLTRRTINVLIRNGVTPERLHGMTDWELRALKDLGPAVLENIRAAYPAPAPTAQAARAAPSAHSTERNS